MREILFRGRTTTGWRYGYFCGKTIDEIGGPVRESEQIIDRESLCWWEIDPATVGQYTGKTDMNGEKVWEGDIVQCYTCGWDEEDGPGVIRWDEDTARFIIENDGVTFDFDTAESDEIEVIGNIHDNPEMLEVDHE